jgi:S1-C subfamily serine protease
MKRVILTSAFLFACIGMLFSQTQQQASLADILENAMSAVVTVSVEKTDGTKQLLGFRGQESDIAYEKALDLSKSKSSGSGFVILKNNKKYIITNAHVIEQASELKGSVYVYSINRSKYEVKIVGGDSFYDIAVLEIIGATGSEIKPISFASKDSRVGEKVFAIGNPLGEYPYTVSDGIISAKNRVRNGMTGKFGFLQSTATVIWGNSGGPLVNEKGQVVGINSQIAFANSGNQQIWQPQINFALEGLLSNRLIDNIINNNGRVKRCYLGIQLSQSYEYSALYKLMGGDGWILVDSIPVINGTISGSPAEKYLKNKIGYQIVKIGNTEIRNIQEALGEFELLTPGSIAKLTIRKGSSTEVINITTEELNPSKNQAIAYAGFEVNNSVKLTSVDGITYISFSEGEYAGVKDEGKKAGGLNKNGKLRGEDINSGKWRIVAAGYDSDNYKSMWKIKELSDLGAALRLTSSIGVIDLYLVKMGSTPTDDVQVKRIGFAGEDQNKSKAILWY